MQYKIYERNAIRVVGVKRPLVEEHDENMRIIPKFWKQAIGTEKFEQICQLVKQEPYGVLGISAFFDPQHIYYHIAAATDRLTPAGLEEFELPAATWCVVTGDPCHQTTFADMYRGLFLEFLPSHGMDYAMLPDIEVYPVRGTGLGTPIREAWFAVKRDGE